MKEKEILDAIKKIVTPYTQRKEGLENFSQKTDFIKDLEVNSMLKILLSANLLQRDWQRYHRP